MSICSLLAITSVIPKNMCLNCFMLESWPGASHSSCIICCCWHTSCRENHIISRQSQDVTRYRYNATWRHLQCATLLKICKITLLCAFLTSATFSQNHVSKNLLSPCMFFFYIHVSMLPLEVHKCWSTAKVWS